MISLRWKFLGAALLLGAAFAGAGVALQPAAPRPAPATLRVARDDKPEPEKPTKPLDLKHAAAVDAMAFTPDGQTLVTASSPKGGQLFLWDTATGKERARATVTHKAAIRALAVSRQGAVASADEDGRLQVWRARDGKLLWVNNNTGAALSGLSFSPDGKTLVGVAGDREVRRWDGEHGKPLPSWIVGEVKEGMRSVAYLPDGKSLLVGGMVTLNEGSSWGAFHLVGADSGVESATTKAAKQPAAKLREATAHLLPVAVAPKGGLWAGAASDNVIHLPKKVTLKGHTKAITALALLPDGRHLVSASRDGTVRFWDVKKAAEVARVSDLGSVGALAVSPDGKRVAWADAKGVVKLRDAAALRKEHALKKAE